MSTTEGVLFIHPKSDDFGCISSHGQRACLHHISQLEPDLWKSILQVPSNTSCPWMRQEGLFLQAGSTLSRRFSCTKRKAVLKLLCVSPQAATHLVAKMQILLCVYHGRGVWPVMQQMSWNLLLMEPVPLCGAPQGTLRLGWCDPAAVALLENLLSAHPRADQFCCPSGQDARAVFQREL